MGFQEEDFERFLQIATPQIAELLANGKAVEIDTSRAGIKLYSFRRRHEQLISKKNHVAESR